MVFWPTPLKTMWNSNYIKVYHLTQKSGVEDAKIRIFCVMEHVILNKCMIHLHILLAKSGHRDLIGRCVGKEPEY